jgi:hypothetical protein
LPTEPPATARASAAPRATATVRPTVTPVPPLPKLRDWQVTTKSEQPRYEIEGSWPDLPNEVPGAAAFNALVQRQANARITSFKTDMAAWEVPKDFPNGSNLGVTYSTTLAAPGFVSVRIEHYSYYAGAAHPNTDSSTLNFDLTSGQPLSLSTQFKPGSNGLKLIADFSTRELRKKLGRDLDEKGVIPNDENYARWNLTPKGVLITFDTYQVGAYVLGSHEVLVPRSALASAIAPGSALDRFVK